MATVTVRFGGSSLPGEVTSLKRSDELLWSEGTGRSAQSGAMTGSVVAGKQTWSVGWGPMTAAQHDQLLAALDGGFKSLSISVGGSTLASITAYRGAVTGEVAGYAGGVLWWKDVAAEFVEK